MEGGLQNVKRATLEFRRFQSGLSTSEPSNTKRAPARMRWGVTLAGCWRYHRCSRCCCCRVRLELQKPGAVETMEAKGRTEARWMNTQAKWRSGPDRQIGGQADGNSRMLCLKPRGSQEFFAHQSLDTCMGWSDDSSVEPLSSQGWVSSSLLSQMRWLYPSSVLCVH